MTGEKLGPACLEIHANSVRTNCKCHKWFICSRPCSCSYQGKGTYDINREDYWPELKVAKWFKEHEKQDVPVYMFDHVGKRSTFPHIRISQRKTKEWNRCGSLIKLS
jgi:hypothetical protein